MNLTFRRLGVSELLPRYIFAESLFVRRRVLEVGAVAATGGASAEFLLQRGARLVLACDEDLEAVAAAQKQLGSANLRFRAAVFDDLPPGGFDLVLVADLAPWVRAPELLRQLVAQVSPTGALVGGLRNPAGLALAQLMEPDAEGVPPTYGQALDALSAHFRSVEVATQSPLLGYQLAFDRSEGLQVDGSLAGSGEAAYFVVVASQEAPRPVDPTWVQLPPAPLAFTGNRLDEVATRAREWEERSRRLKENLERARRDADALKEELASARQARERAEEETRRWQAQAEARERHPLQPLAQDELAARVRRLEAEVRGARERASDAERSLGVQRAELDAVHQEQREGLAQVLAAQESVRLERARREEVQRLLDDARTKLTAAYEELRGVREELVQSQAEGAQADPGPDRRAVEERLAQARERELRLAEQHSTALQAIEALQGNAARERARAEALEQRAAWLEAERARAERALEANATRLRAAEARSAEASESALAASAAETELAALRDSVERLSARVSVAEAQEGQARALADRLEAELAQARQTASLSSEERQGQEAALVRAAGELEAALRERDAALGRAAEAAAGLEAAAAGDAALQADLAAAQAAHSELRLRAEASEAELAEARGALGEAGAARERLELERSELGGRLEATEASLREAADRVAALEAEAASGVAARLREQLEQTQGQLRVARALRDSLMRDLEAERERARGLSEASGASGARLAEVETAAAQANEELERLRDTASTAAFERSALEQQLQASSAREEALSQELTPLRRQLSDVEEQLTVLVAERAELAGRVEALEGALAAEQQARSVAEVEAEAAQRLAAETGRRADELHAAAEATTPLRGEVEDLRRRLAEAEAARTRTAELEAKLGEAQSRLELVQRRATAQETELSALRRATGRPSAEELRSIYERAQAEISAAREGARRTTRPDTTPPPPSEPPGTKKR